MRKPALCNHLSCVRENLFGISNQFQHITRLAVQPQNIARDLKFLDLGRKGIVLSMFCFRIWEKQVFSSLGFIFHMHLLSHAVHYRVNRFRNP